MLNRGDLAQVMVAPLGTSTELDPLAANKVVCAPGDVVTTPGTALSVARKAMPGLELASLSIPTDANAPYKIWLRPAHSTVPARGNAEVVIDRHCGTILHPVRRTGCRPGIRS